MAGQFHQTGAGERQPTRDLYALRVDTTAGSALHGLYRFLGAAWPAPKLYGIVVALTFVPLLVAACLGPLSLLVPSATLRLPFLRDWNVLFDFLVSFPSIVVLAATDQHVLAASLKGVQLDGTVTVAESDAAAISARWRRRFFLTNVAGQLTGIAIGIVVACFNYKIYADSSVGYWIARGGSLLPVGYVFLWCVFLLFAVITLYLFRSIAVALLLRDLVAHSRLRPLPLHPDKSGGLRPVGRLGLRNQYVLMLVGVNVVLLITVSVLYLPALRDLSALMVAAVVAYLILGPLVFVAPLLPFREGMRRAKAELMIEVARRLRLELQRMHSRLESGPILREDEELIDRLRKMDEVIDQLPVWPFDAVTLRKFLIAYGVPLLTSAGYPLLKSLLDFARTRLH